MSEMQWEINKRTLRDCPGNRTEIEWTAAVLSLADKLARKHEAKRCPTCKQEIARGAARYAVTETEGWLPGDVALPHGRWALHVSAHTLRDARALQKFMGEHATIWKKIRQEGNSTSYKELDACPKSKKTGSSKTSKTSS